MSERFHGAGPVREAHRFDVGAHEAYMRAQGDGFGGPLTVEQFKGGQSIPTFILKTPARAYVLRRKPLFEPRNSERDEASANSGSSHANQSFFPKTALSAALFTLHTRQKKEERNVVGATF